MKNILTCALALASISLAFTQSASAQLLRNGPSVFNYNYFDALYLDSDGADGLGLLFSADIRDNYALQVGYARLTEGRFDADTVTGGVAYHIETANYQGRADWVLDLGFQIVDAEGVDETGLYAGAGMRFAVNDALELNGSLNLTTAFDTDLSVNLRALYEVATGFSALLETDIGDGTALGVGLRYYWR